MLTVWSVCTGHKYNPAYVYELRDAVAKNLREPHVFKCVTEHELEDIHCVRPIVDWHGWWQKLSLFRLADGPSIYFDLDTIIVGNLDYLVRFIDVPTIAAPANWAASGHGGIQSSVMAWGGNYPDPFDVFRYEHDSKRLWGDQEFLWELLGDNWTRVPYVGSYKYHCRQCIPQDLSVIVCHGKPDPHEINDEWILKFTSTLRSRIRSNTANGSRQDSNATVSALL